MTLRLHYNVKVSRLGPFSPLIESKSKGRIECRRKLKLDKNANMRPNAKVRLNISFPWKMCSPEISCYGKGLQLTLDSW